MTGFISILSSQLHILGKAAVSLPIVAALGTALAVGHVAWVHRVAIWRSFTLRSFLESLVR